MNRSVILLLLLAANNILNAQITVGNLNKEKIEKTVLKPAPYDSLKRYSEQGQLIDYYQYVGLKFYIPPISNPTRGDQGSGQFGFLFTDSLQIIKAEKVLKRSFNSSELTQPHYDKLATIIYKPHHYYSATKGNDKIGVSSDAKEVGGNYYTVIDVIYEKQLDSIWQQMHDQYYEFKRRGEGDMFIQNYRDALGLSWKRVQVIFLLKNDKNEDFLYCSRLERMTLVPYFVKQKQIYEGKRIICMEPPFYTKYHRDILTGNKLTIEKGSLWTCTEVTLLKRGQVENNSSENHVLYHLLKNEVGQIIAMEVMEDKSNYHTFILYDLYLERERHKKLEQATVEAKRIREEQLKKEEERVAQAKHRTACINKFGQANGELIASGKVKIGMTKEMCRMAWNIPFWTDKTTTKYGTSEHWYYGFGYSLHFVNGSLKRIDE